MSNRVVKHSTRYQGPSGDSRPAAEKFGQRHHSPHEAYAVMLEEYEEIKLDMSWIDDHMKGLWGLVKVNVTDHMREDAINHIKSHAVDAACEAIQLAAMCEKALRGYETEDRL